MQKASPRATLSQDHERLDRLLEDVMAAARRDESDRNVVTRAWETFERALLDHLDVEEIFLLPGLALEHPQEAEWVRAEHNHLRHDIGEIGVACDLHMVMLTMLEEFARKLREHARREDSMLYPWAERSLSAERAKHAVGWLERARHRGHR